MSGFTQKEIADTNTTTLLHCGSPMKTWDATDAENPICDICH
jgi:hypothetical protein